ncbi:MAG: glyceraldehyde 3-phosphate dehydrogenase NAD-binding domain-containing protein, partial [archaeon]
MSSEKGLEGDSSIDESEILRVGLNGFGRIGRSVFRAVLDDPRVELVGINDIMEREEMAYLAKYDSVMGSLDEVSLEGESLVYGDTSVPLYNIQDPG